MGYQYAFAITRDELNQAEDEIITIKDNIISLDDDIDSIRITISNYEKSIKNEKEILKQIKNEAQGSWDAAKKITDQEDVIIQEQKHYAESRETLFSLLREKSDQVKQLKELELLSNQIIHEDTTPLNDLVRKIGIINSNVCITLLKNDIQTTCPTYKQLIQLDSSITEISGRFTTDDNGYFHRGNPSSNTSFRYYDHDKTPRLFVDPPREMLSRIKIIELRPNFDTYYDRVGLSEYADITTLDDIFGNVTESVQHRVVYHDRYANKSCTHIIINADKWKLLLPDTIYYVRNNCNELFTGYITKELIQINNTEYNIADSPAYQELEYWNDKAKFCIFKYRQC